MPDILSAAELNDLRKTVRDLALPGTALLLRPTTTPDGIGGVTTQWGTVSLGGTTLIPCRFRPTGPGERPIAGRVWGVSGWEVVLPAEWDVRQSDRIYLYGADRTLAVQGVQAPTTWELQRRVLCTEQR